MKIKENSFTNILICVSLLYVENSIFYDFFNQHRYKIGNLKIKSSISSSLHIFKQSKRRVNKNQTLQDKRLKQLESKLSEYDEQYDCSYDYTDYEGQQYTGQEDQPVVVSEIEQQNIDIIPNENDPPSIFEGIFKKYNQVDEVDIPVNAHLATLVNKVF